MCVLGSGVGKEYFLRVMDEYRLDDYPRVLASPNQNMAYNREIAFRFVNYCDAMGKPAFVSANSYKDFDQYQNPSNINFTKLLLDVDMDTGQSPEVVLLEVRRIIKWMNEHKVTHVVSFSGAGFHVIPLFEPKVYTLDRDLSNKIRAIADFFKSGVFDGGEKMKCINIQCAEPKRLMRIPYSRYVPKTGGGEDRWEVRNNYCIPLEDDMVLNLDYESILKISFSPPVYDHPVVVQQNKRYLKDFINEFNIKPREYTKDEMGEFWETGVDFTSKANTDFIGLMKMMIPLPCLCKALMMKNPPHMIRFRACAFLKDVLNEEEAQSFFDRLAYECEWNDRENTFERHKQVASVYRGGYALNSCKGLQDIGICLKEECYKWKVSE
jgi:hypothetical protein